MKESDIRPQDLFRRYLELARRDALGFFQKEQFVAVNCPACDSKIHSHAFEKFGFRYVLCDECGSLYNSPRPTFEMLMDYYRRGEAVQFWGSDFFRATAESRKEKIFRPRAEGIAELTKNEKALSGGTFLDLGAGYGLFYDELKKTGRFSHIVGVEPSPNLAQVCREKGLTVIEKYVEELCGEDTQGTVAAAYEVLEHVFAPLAFLHGTNRVLCEGGLFVFTTLTISGFDLQVLWEESNSIFPPHHINLLSTEGIERLVDRSGFEIVEIATPGKLDVDIVANILAERPDVQVPRFFSYLLNNRDGRTREDFQFFLQKHLLSSHVRVIARKTN